MSQPLAPEESAFLRKQTKGFNPDQMEAVYKNLDKGEYHVMLGIAMRIRKERDEAEKSGEVEGQEAIEHEHPRRPTAQQAKARGNNVTSRDSELQVGGSRT
jgi:hypothetical protein